MSIKPIGYSVIINYFNSIEFLDDAINSLLNQTYKNWQLIFVDNCSKVSPLKELRSVKNKVIYLRLDKTMPLGYARNKALTLCDTEYFGFLDSDDIWLPNKIEMHVKAFMVDPRIGLVASECGLIKNKKFLRKFTNSKRISNKDALKTIIKKNFLVMSSVSIRSEFIKKNKILFDEKMQILEDTIFFFEILKISNYFCIPEILCFWRYSINSTTFKNLDRVLFEKKYFRDKYLLELEIFKNIDLITYNERLILLEGIIEYRNGKNKNCRKKLSSLIYRYNKALVIYILTFLPGQFGIKIYEFIKGNPMI